MMTFTKGAIALSKSLRAVFMTAATVLIATNAYATSHVADNPTDIGAGQRIDSAGKLRMLSQRVVAAACYAQAEIETDAAIGMMNSAAEEFLAISSALEFGDAGRGMNGAETDLKTLATLERLAGLWAPMNEIVSKVATGTATNADITELAVQSQPTLEMAQRLVTTISAEYSQGAAMVMRDALAIDVAGRQRMLAQRISKETCLLGTGTQTAASVDNLNNANEVFGSSLSALQNGMPAAGIMAPTNDAVIANLEIAAAEWAIAKPRIAAAVAGEQLSSEELGEIFGLANSLTGKMNQVVIDYTQAAM